MMKESKLQLQAKFKPGCEVNKRAKKRAKAARARVKVVVVVEKEKD
jgi:hypothetical protein